MGRLLEIAVGEKSDELRALFRAAAKDAIYALMDAEFAKGEALRDPKTLDWLRRAMAETRFAAIGDALMDVALARDDAVRRAGKDALEADVARLVNEHLRKFVELNL